MAKDGDKIVQDWNEILRYRASIREKYLEFLHLIFLPRIEMVHDYEKMVNEVRN